MTLWVLVCIENHTKSDWYAHIKMIRHLTSQHCWNATLEHQYFITAQNTWIVIIFGMYIESQFVKHMLKGTWLLNKFGGLFWGKVKIDALKVGGGYKQKGNDNTIFSLSNS